MSYPFIPCKSNSSAHSSEPRHDTITVLEAPYTINKKVKPGPKLGAKVERGGAISKGTFKVLHVDSDNFDEVFNSFTDKQVPLMGVPVGGLTEGVLSTVDVIQSGAAPEGAIARSLQYFDLSGRGYIFLDVDDDFDPYAVLEKVYEHDPGLKGAEVKIIQSSRHEVRDEKGRVRLQNGGHHIYIRVENREVLGAWQRHFKQKLNDLGHYKTVTNKNEAKRKDYFMDFGPLGDQAIRECFESVKLPRGWKAHREIKTLNKGGVGELTKPLVPHAAKTQGKAQVRIDSTIPMTHQQIADECGLVKKGKVFVDPNENDNKFYPKHHRDSSEPIFFCHHANHPITEGGEKNTFGAAAMLAHFVFDGDYKKAYQRYGVSVTAEQKEDAEKTHRLSEAANYRVEQALWDYYLSSISDNLVDDSRAGEAARHAKLMPGNLAAINAFGEKHGINGIEIHTDSHGRKWPESDGGKELSSLLNDALVGAYSGSTRPAEGQWLQPEKIQKADMADIRDNVVVQAPMGAGKSEGADGLIGSRKALIIAPYRALTRELAVRLGGGHSTKDKTRQLASELKAGHYEDDKERLSQFDRVVVTPNSLHRSHIQEWLGLTEFGEGDLPDVVVYDEAATIASSVGAVGGGFLKEAEVNENISTLLTLKQAGVQTVFMDAHVTPALRTLCDIGGVERYVTFDSEYEQPEVVLHIVEKVTGEDGKTHETNPIEDLIPATGDVVVVCDSKSSVELMAKRHSLVPLHGENGGDDEQRVLLDDPEGEAKRRSESPEGLRVTYSPVLGAGWSNTSVEPVVVANYEGNVSPLVFMQMLRRFRRPKGGKIHVQIRPCAFSPKRYDRETNPGEWLASFRKMCNPDDLNVSIGRDARDALRASAMAEEERLGESYAHALYVALKEDGFQVSVVENDALEADTAWKADKRSVKEREIDAVAEATVLSDQEMKALNRKDRLDSTEQKQKKATVMVLKLLLDDRDKDPEKPGWNRDVVEAFMHKGLAKRLDRVWVARAIREDIDEHDDRMVHDLAVRTLEFVGVDLHKLHERGRKAVKAEEVDELLADVRKVFGSPQAALAACERLGLPRLPRKSPRSSRVKSRWMRDWLQAFGLVQDGRTKVGSKKGRVNASQWKLEAMVATYLERRIEIEKGVSSEPKESIPTSVSEETHREAKKSFENKILEEVSGEYSATAPDPLARASKGGLPGVKKGRKKTSRAPQGADRIGAIPTTPRSEWTAQQRIDALIVMSGFAQPGDVRFQGLELPANDSEYAKRSAA